MANNEAGAFLNITPDVLKKLDSFDDKLEQIEKHAHTAADALKNGFGKVVVDTSKLENAITSLAKKIDAIKGNPFEGAGRGAEDTEKKTKSLNESLSRAAVLMNQIGNSKIGEGSFSSWNIKGLNQYYSDLKKYVENADLSKPQQEAVVRAMQYMKMELAEQRKTDEQRAQSAENAARRKEVADKRAAKAAAESAKAQNYQKNTTTQGALDFSKTANTLQRQITAIEYLKKARLSLNTTDANYKNTLNQINQAIAKHNQALTEAGIKSQQLATRHRNLMDTAGQLSRQLALVFSVSQIEGYIGKLANVRGEFELQQRSLQVILQNKSQADQIFNKTVQLAVKSPYKIKELVSFTKQLAAYRIESSKLYDTTKRLADVSAGLGVDMGRLILAYGQVKAAAYLRGSEVRQFTEAGINMYGELQKLFKERDQADYTTAQIVDMISKRKVTFEDVEEIFERLTEKEGLFYNMQEIQAETLQGKISNLQDSIDVMLNSIGKANEDTLKGTIDTVKILIENWETVVEVAKTFGVIVGSLVITSKLKLASKEAMTLSTFLDKGVDSAFAFGKALKASLPLMALGLAIQYVTNLTSRLNEYNKTISNIGNKKYEARLKIEEFDNEAKTDARKALDALVKEMNNAGFSIKIKTDLSEEEARKQFDDYKKRYEEFIEDITSIEAKYAALKKGEGFIGEAFGGNIDESLSSYSEKAGELMIVGNQARKELLRIATESKTLTEQQKQELKELAINAKDSAEGYAEVANKLREVTKVDIQTFTTSFGAAMSNITTSFGGLQSKVLEGFLNTSKGFDAATENAKEKIIALFGEVNKEISSDEKNKLKLNIDTIFLNKQIDEVTRNFAYKIYDIPRVSNIEEETKREPDVDPKLQRDILAERISLIKELNKEYEKLNKVMGSKEAAKTVMERYASQLKDVKMPENIIGKAFLPNKENTAKALQELAKIIADFRKRIGAEKDANVLFDEKDAEDIKKQLDITKKNIEDMFNGLDLHKKLKDAGLSEAEVQQLFPGLAKTLDDVEKGIRNEYEAKRDKNGELSKTDQKDYDEALKKLNQQRIKESQDLVVELTKAYKTQLSDQMQLDTWYIKERSKIYSKAYDEQTKTFKDILTPEMQKQYEENLNKEYQKRSSENTWKNFQATDSYISMFENMDKISGESIQRMLEKLESLRSSLKGLPADQVRAIINQMEKLREVQVERNPFKAAIDGIKELKEAREGLVKLDEKGESTGIVISEEEVRRLQVASDDAKVLAETEAQDRNLKLQDLELQRDELVKYTTQQYKETDEYKNQLADLNQKIADQRKLVNLAIIEAELQGKISHEYAEQLRLLANAEDKVEKGIVGVLNDVATIANEVSSSITEITGNLENVFGTMSAGTKDTIDSISEIAGGIGQAAQGASQFAMGYMTMNLVQMVTGGIQALSGLTKTIGALFAIGDKKKEREIQRQIKNIEDLGKAYDNLKEKMEAAWSADDLRTQTKDTVANLDQQIESYNAMIKAEQDKKKTDKDRIKEWQEAIEELEKTKQEILDEERKYMGGIGGEEEYKSAAESFVQAWMDAFNETGDGLKGLEENFDDMINNLFLKQASMRIANKFLEPLFQMIDLAVTEGEEAIAAGFDGDTKVTRQEMDKIIEEAKKQFPQLSEALEQLYNALGLKNNKTAELSSLTQSIQGLTEQTADELAAILESVRFFVAQQTTDISAIRALLDARYSLESEYSDSNPMLVELRAQTGYLEILSDRIDRVFATNANSRGAGLRVYMQ
ncbi:tape measure protein [uncultured Bacteroides sp.]|uniref:tape measure protein n=1 Tax=uncultured Bacteroides sp. TaxID=162156 RepID=UPI00259245AC|nr:tape measure protein [uncultured Bacteroides sp.]